MSEKKRHAIHSNFSFNSSWGESSNSIWLATTLTLQRNIDKFHFPQKLDSQKLVSVEQLILKTCVGAPEFDSSSSTSLLLEECSFLSREYLQEHFLIFDPPQGSVKGSAIIYDQNGVYAACVNFADHLHLHCLDLQGELEKNYEKLILIEQHVEKKLAYAYSDRFGYLTSDPSKSGTGLVVKAFVHIPALITLDNFMSFIEEDQQEIIDYSGIQGVRENVIGDIVVLFNRWTLGVTEEMILSSIRTEVLKLMTHERVLREKIIQDRDPRVIDRISRAIGLAKYSFSIDTSEALNTLSMIKFGVELGWVSGCDVQQLNRLLLQCRRAHLIESMRLQGKEPQAIPDQKLVYQSRAALLRDALASVELRMV